jgi:hypothetical protein
LGAGGRQSRGVLKCVGFGRTNRDKKMGKAWDTRVVERGPDIHASSTTSKYLITTVDEQ